MKKILFILILVAVAARLNAQTPPQAKSNTPAKVDTSEQHRMPVVKPNTNSTMPVIKPQNNSPMPVIKPKADTVFDKRGKTAPKM
jgi:hypothetical protein